MNKTTNLFLLVAVLVTLLLGAALAENKPTVTITRPLVAAVVSGSQVEVEVAYRSNSGEPIVQAEVQIDRQFRFGGRIEPTLSGTSAFLWDTTLCQDGPHSIGAAALDAAGNAGSVAINVKIANIKIPVAEPFSIAIISPTEGEEVKGTADVLVKAQNDGDVKWVSYFIDGDFWAARNFPPFLQRWDTTEYADGQHLLSVAAFGPDEARATASVTVFVNNSGEPLLAAAAAEEGEAPPPEEVVHMAPVPGLEAAAFAPPAQDILPAPLSALEGVVLATNLLPQEPSALAEMSSTSPATDQALVMLPTPPPGAASLQPELIPVEATLAPEVRLTVYGEPSRTMPGADTDHPTPASLAPALPGPLTPAQATSSEQVFAPQTEGPATAPQVVEPAQAFVMLPQVPASAPSFPALPALAPMAPESGLTSAAATKPLPSTPESPLPSSTPVSAALPQPYMVSGVEPSPEPDLTPGKETDLSPATALPSGTQPAAGAPLAVVMLPTHRSEEELAPYTESPLPSTPASTPGLPIVYYDGQGITFPDVPAHIYKGMTLVPFRFLVEHKGGKVEWFPEGERVEAVTADGNKLIQLQIGSKEVLVNGEKTVMPIRAYLLPPGRTIVPLRFFSQILDANLVYDSSTGNLFLTSRSPETQPPSELLTSQ